MNPIFPALSIFFAAVFTNNILLTNYLGMCSFLSVSREIKTSLGLGAAVVFVMTMTSAHSNSARSDSLRPRPSVPRPDCPTGPRSAVAANGRHCSVAAHLSGG